MPSTSAPRRTASSASSRRSSPGSRRIGSIPRFRHSTTSWNRSTFPPPDFGFMISTGCSGWRGPGQPGRVRPQRPVGAPQRVPRGQHRRRRPARRSATTRNQRIPAKNRPAMVPPSAASHDQQRDHPDQPAPGYGVPAARHADQQPGGDDQDGQQVHGHADQRETGRGHQGQQGTDRGKPLPRGRTIRFAACAVKRSPRHVAPQPRSPGQLPVAPFYLGVSIRA